MGKRDLQTEFFASMADPDQKDLAVTTEKGNRVVQTPHYAPNVMASVLVVEIDGGTVKR